MNATTSTRTNIATGTGELTFVGFATWLDETATVDGHIELWRDGAGHMFAWSVKASGESSVRMLN